MHKRQVIDYIALALIWGFSFLLLLQVVNAFGYVGAVSFRALVASSVLFLIAKSTGRPLNFAGRKLQLAVLGATSVSGNLIGMSYATPRIGTAMTAICVGAIPLFSVVIGRIWGIEKITRVGAVGLVIGFIGLVLLVGFPAVPITRLFILGCVGGLLSSMSAAFGSNWAQRFLSDVNSWEQTIGAFWSAGLMTLPLLFIVPVPGPVQPIDFVWLIALAVTCSSLAYVLYFRLVSELGATVAVSVEFAVTVVAVIVGAIVLSEVLTVIQIVGAVLIIFGCSLVLGLIGKPKKHAVIEHF